MDMRFRKGDVGLIAARVVSEIVPGGDFVAVTIESADAPPITVHVDALEMKRPHIVVGDFVKGKSEEVGEVIGIHEDKDGDYLWLRVRRAGRYEFITVAYHSAERVTCREEFEP